MSKIILICGITGTGKTALSIALAKKYNAVILNADSTQIYSEPLIATAKVTEEEKEGIEHLLFDKVSLNEDYTLYDYQKDARSILNKLIDENKNVIIVGGSGLYIKALLYNYNLEVTEKVSFDYSKYTNEELKQMANEIDSDNQIHVNNRQRLERYITYFKQTGKKVEKKSEIDNKVYDFISIGLKADREVLYKKLDQRVDKMVSNGLVKEAKNLFDKKLKNFTNIIGYRELNKYFLDEISLEEAIDEIKKNTRHYAKRQFTWFNNQMKDITWFETNYEDYNKTINEVIKFIENKKNQ